jgi:hypothetical protein
MTNAPTCFGSHRNHPQGTVQYLAKNYKYCSTVLVGMDVVSVMAACEPVCCNTCLHRDLYTSHTSTQVHITLTTSMPTSTVEQYL